MFRASGFVALAIFGLCGQLFSNIRTVDAQETYFPAQQSYDPPVVPRAAESWGPQVDIEVGAKAPVIDGVGWLFGVPRKILLWDKRADNHRVSDATIDEVARYIDTKDLHDVKVRINQYDPGGEWRRLAANKRVGAGWRYTVGALSTLGYTLAPGRLFGRDRYNPYTNTLSVYSDAPLVGVGRGRLCQRRSHS